MNDMANVKGFAIRGLLKYIKNARGSGSIAEILTQLPEEDRKHFVQPINASLWYPYSVFIHLLRAIDAKLGDGDFALCRHIGYVTAERDVQGIFKIIAAISSFRSVVGRSAGFWNRYYDSGRYEVVDASETHATVRIHDFPDVDPAHCILMEGWFESTARLSGEKNFRVRHTQCVRRGAQYCEFTGNRV